MVELLREPSLGPLGRSQEGEQGSPGLFDFGVRPDQVLDQTFTDSFSSALGSMCLPRSSRSYIVVGAFAVDFFSSQVRIAAASKLRRFHLAATTVGSLQKCR